MLLATPVAVWASADLADDSVGVTVHISPLPTNSETPEPTVAATAAPAPVSDEQGRDGELPPTGVDAWPAIGFALASMGVGATIVAAYRRGRSGAATEE